MQQGKLTLTVTLPEEISLTRATQLSLKFEPLTPGLPEQTAAGSVMDYLTLGNARFIVTDVAEDFSRISLALIAGNLQASIERQLELGTSMPPFSQVDLVQRASITREKLLARAEGSAPIVFVFGELAPATGRPPYAPSGGPGMSSVLPLPVVDVVEQLELELNPKPVIVFVTRQIGLEFLYGELRNKTPSYLVLSDFADPMRTMFRAPQPHHGGWYGPSYGSPELSLRQTFNMPEGKLSIAAFDSAGKVVYVDTDAAGNFLGSIAEARRAMRQL
jgi:hypothetical protein